MPLEAKKKQQELDKLEDGLSKAWNQLKAMNGLNQVQRNWIFGRYCVRAVLLILNKGKRGREETLYDSMAEIEQTLQDEILAKGQSRVPQQAATSNVVDEAVTLDQGHDAMYLANRKLNLEIGSLWTHKDHPGTLWALEAKSSTGVKLMYYDPIQDKKQELEVRAEEVVQKLKTSKGKLATLMDCDMVEEAFPNMVCTHETLRCQAYLDLSQAYNEWDADTKTLQFLQGAKIKLFARAPFKKNELIFVPVTDKASSLVFEKPSTSDAGKMKLVASKEEVWILPPKPFKAGPPAAGVIVPYFICKHNKDEEGNMDLKTMVYKGLSIDVLTNVVPLAKGDEILMKTEKKESKALPPAKRQKK